ncbi:Xylose isomerase-like TIM barrel [uncultured Clostridium sp.]|nr:Xylose isomerase-like TIM barrel [uncultured Clostridium sp.]
MNKLALQLFSLREYTPDDLRGVLKKTAQMGYDAVEFAGLFGEDPAALRAYMDELNLGTMSFHVGLKALHEDLDAQIAAAKALGGQYIACPALPQRDTATVEDYKNAARFFTQVGQKCRDNGLQFAFHNHQWEFVDLGGVTGMDILLENTLPEVCQVELDTAWCDYAKYGTLNFMRKYAGRVPLLHIKDMHAFGEEDDCTIGQGAMDFAPILQLAKAQGVDWYIVEQEYFDYDPFQSLKDGADYLRPLLED